MKPISQWGIGSAICWGEGNSFGFEMAKIAIFFPVAIPKDSVVLDHLYYSVVVF
jgi:hypothetical protein